MRYEARRATPKHDYPATLHAIQSAIDAALTEILPSLSNVKKSDQAQIGIGMPGSISPQTGCVQNANSTWLNGKPFKEDIEAALQTRVRLANDADCFALSEATDGAGQNATSVFGVILGTGCGGGIVRNGTLMTGPHHIGGEWGHTCLPWQTRDEFPGPQCWCGRKGCMETWVSGPALRAWHAKQTGHDLEPETIVARAKEGDAQAQQALDQHGDRLARGLAAVSNIIDPDMIVLGGGLSKMLHLYQVLPNLMKRWIFADKPNPKISPPQWGDASGVRGAARLWDVNSKA